MRSALFWNEARDQVSTTQSGKAAAETPLVTAQRLDPSALLADDLDRLFAALDLGLATPEHAAFAARLARIGEPS